MKLFSAKKADSAESFAVKPTLSVSNKHPFSLIDNYSPLSDTELELYSSLREAVPVIDAAISKIVRLTGTFKVVCDDERATNELSRFLENIKVNATSHGIKSFILTYLDQLLTYGTAVGEIVMNPDGLSIAALYNASLKNVVLKRTDSDIDVDIFVKDSYGKAKAIENKNLVMVTALNAQPSKVYGESVMKGLPFVSSILLKIFNTIGVNFDRVGNVRFAVTYKPNDNSHISPKQRVQEIASQWSSAMRDKSQVCDFVSVGDVSVKVIGADNQILSCDIEIRHLLEQIVSKLCIPPFLLGLSWSSTERMSVQQADILTSELEYFRSLLEPVIRRISSLYLRINGYDDNYTIEWNNINLQDEVELADARLKNAQARSIEIQNSLAEVRN